MLTWVCFYGCYDLKIVNMYTLKIILINLSHFTLQQQIFLVIYKLTLETTLYSKYNFAINKPIV